jgi:hypothetical protein
MRRIAVKRGLFIVLLVGFLAAEGLLVAYARRTLRHVDYLCKRAEAAAQRAEAAAK